MQVPQPASVANRMYTPPRIASHIRIYTCVHAYRGTTAGVKKPCGATRRSSTVGHLSAAEEAPERARVDRRGRPGPRLGRRRHPGQPAHSGTATRYDGGGCGDDNDHKRPAHDRLHDDDPSCDNHHD